MVLCELQTENHTDPDVSRCDPFLRTVGALIQRRKQTSAMSGKRSGLLLAPVAVTEAPKERAWRSASLLWRGTASSLVSFGGCRLKCRKQGHSVVWRDVVTFLSVGRRIQQPETAAGEKDKQRSPIPHPGPLPSF